MRRNGLVAIAVFLVAGCSQYPVSSNETRHDLTRARYDNGGMAGSGNIADPDGAEA